tara:strand:+ start:186 stop:419 length:234 start_codon:yes stop_codon:yes gene_type:complete
MAHVQIIKKINEERLLVTIDGKHALLSHSERGQPPETLAFWSDEDGQVSRWREIAGAPNMNFAEVIQELTQYGPHSY